MSEPFSVAQTPQLVMFDYDGTLAPSKQPIDHAMGIALAKLLERMPVAVTCVGALPHLLKLLVARLPESARLSNLSLLPASGGALYQYVDGGWERVYEETINESDTRAIETAVRDGARATGFVDFAEPAWGERIEHRGAQVALLALGTDAPLVEKRAWDPDRRKRSALVDAISARLPAGYRATIGGTATIAIAKARVDKAYGVRQLCTRLHISEADVLYVGDELGTDGNDASVLATNAQVYAVDDSTDTTRVIVSLLPS